MKSQYQQGNSKYSNSVIYSFMVDNLVNRNNGIFYREWLFSPIFSHLRDQPIINLNSFAFVVDQILQVFPNTKTNGASQDTFQQICLNSRVKTTESRCSTYFIYYLTNKWGFFTFRTTKLFEIFGSHCLHFRFDKIDWINNKSSCCRTCASNGKRN